MKDTAIYWFRDDLRIDDNLALNVASKHSAFYPIFILDPKSPNFNASCKKLWQHKALESLCSVLKNKISFYYGNPEKIISELCEEHGCSSVYWNRMYEPFYMKRDAQIKDKLTKMDIYVESFNSSLLFEPWEVLKSDGTEYRVFTPFFKACLKAKEPRHPIGSAKNFNPKKAINSLSLQDLELLPKEQWYRSLIKRFEINETAADKLLTEFVIDKLKNYKQGRDIPSLNSVSFLSAYISNGIISVHKIWHAISNLPASDNKKHFLSELCWREFSYYTHYYNQNMVTKNLNPKFDKFAWVKKSKHIKAWQQGKTGSPIVDAGMRELWQTGYMHNRVRMITASFLVKNLGIDWRIGARWFFDCLNDADLANNYASWQWVAGCGRDAAPYFRIFNPITQGEKFDADGEYILQYCPELKGLPNKFLHQPFNAPPEVLLDAGITLGKDYPKIIIDLKKSREQALALYADIKGS